MYLGSRCAQLLLEGGAEVNVLTRESRLTPLHVAARRGLEEHVELFLSHGADVLVKNREGETPLNAACAAAERPAEAGRYLRVVQLLLDAGADPRTAGRKLHTPLHNACANCSHRISDILLQHGARADIENCAGYTPMDYLVQVMDECWLECRGDREGERAKEFSLVVKSRINNTQIMHHLLYIYSTYTILFIFIYLFFRNDIVRQQG